jgi:hypothetical protein
MGIGASGKSGHRWLQQRFMYVLCHPVGPVVSGEVQPILPPPMRSQHLTVIPTDLPTLQPRVDNPQSRRGGDHNRSERSGCLIYG